MYKLTIYNTLLFILLVSFRSKHFQGRKDVLQTIKKYLRSGVTTPLVLHGSAGSGKTALMAKAVKETRKWLKGYIYLLHHLVYFLYPCIFQICLFC